MAPRLWPRWGASAASAMFLRRRRLGAAPSQVGPGDADWRGSFAERHPLNVPGSVYAAATDTCCCGPAEAPSNVLHDDDGQEFVWRQPRSDAEVEAVARAAWADPFGGYGRDGDEHWTPDLIAEWWTGLPLRQEKIARVLSSPLVMGNAADNMLVERARTEWVRYWGSPQLLFDLRRYSFHQDQGRWPQPQEALPPVDRRRR